MLSLFGRSTTSNAAHKSIRLYPENERMLSDLSAKLGIPDISTLIRIAIIVLYEVVHMPRLYDLFWKLNQVGVLQPGRPPLCVPHGGICATESSKPLK